MKPDLTGLELNHLSLPLLVSSELKVLGPLDGHLETMLACTALQTKYQLLGSLGLLTQNRLGLTTKTLLFSVVTPFALGEDRLLGLLVLGHLELLMLVAMRTVGPAGFWDVDHFVSMLNGKRNYDQW